MSNKDEEREKASSDNEYFQNLKQIFEDTDAKDWSEFNLSRDNENEVDYNIILPYVSTKNGENSTNLGLHFYNSRIYTSGYVGVVWLKKFGKETDKGTIVEHDGERIKLMVQPRFGGDNVITKILNEVLADEEADAYLADESLYHFYEDEPLIDMGENISEKISDISIFTVALFLKSLKSLCLKSIKYEMNKVEETLNGRVKGKILINKQIRQNIIYGRIDRTVCSYQVFSINSKENQILKAALNKCTTYLNTHLNTHKNNDLLYETAMYCRHILEHVNNVRITDKDFNGLKYNGVYSHYKPAIENAKRVIKNLSITFNGELKLIKTIPFWINMNKLFEFYVRTKIRQTLKEIGSKEGKLKNYVPFKIKYDKHIPDNFFVFKDKLKVISISRYLIPDILIEYNNKNYVLDVKYKNVESGNDRELTHQILAYGKLFNTQGLGLIFPQKLEEDEYKHRYSFNFPFESENTNDRYATFWIHLESDGQDNNFKEALNWILLGER